MTMAGVALPSRKDDYLTSRRQAWFAFAMTFGLMLFDYIDRQVIVSLFPHIKSEWNLSDKQLGALVSIISIVVAIGGIPVALLADRVSRVKSIFVMASVWSLASISCMFTNNFGQLFAARAVVGAGETGYGSVGAALISTLFPKRLRGALLGAFFAAASLGSVLGVVLGGMIAAKWGWRAAFGVVGVPGLVMALLYLLVRDYKTVALTPRLDKVTQSLGATLKHIFGALARTRTMLWVCVGSAMQLIVVSAVWSWLPSYLNRFQGIAPDAAGKQAAMVVLVGAVGSVFWGYVVDRLALRRPRNKLPALAVLCLVTLAIFLVAFAGTEPGETQFKLVLLGGFFMTCTVGVVSGVVIDVIHPGVRSTGSAVLSLFQNLFGLAVGPFLVGVLSDQWGLQQAMAIVPCFSVLAAAAFIWSARSYDADVAKVSNVALAVAP
ncbi:MFS transporter [Variovorax sp. J22R115]|uniref:MFS transporter n=1 Tax=Variovorax sp. J22R115 TaxID=3053509 RepID=UPI00257734DA|nr:MFS transporter [Variovorax sp. J22R115]MDM0052894.1 MFS transporter [Variovorax sp. J22R115]